MPTGQASAVAIGTVVAVLGGFYITWRAEQPRQSAWILRVLLNASVVGMGLYTGTFLLLMEPTDLIRSGVGIFAYTSVVRTAFSGWRHARGVPSLSMDRKMLLTYSVGNVVAASLLGAGCVRYGGPIGDLGAIVALSWITLHLWVLMNFLVLHETCDQTRAAISPHRNGA